jgi:hypothetical protein
MFLLGTEQRQRLPPCILRAQYPSATDRGMSLGERVGLNDYR